MPRVSGVSPFAAIGLLLGILTAASADTRPAIDLSNMVAMVAHEPWPAGRDPAGSGFVVSANGKVFTAAHVVAGCRKIFVTPRGNAGPAFPAVLLGQDSRLDAALLSAPKLARSHGILRFSDVIPAENAALTVASGLDDAKPRRVTSLGVTAEPDTGPVLHLRADLPPGISGAPVLNRRGDVAAVVIGKLKKRDGITIGMQAGALKGFLDYFGVAAPRSEPNSGPAAKQGAKGNREEGTDAMVRVTCK